MEDCLKEFNMHIERHFGGDALTGNIVHKAYISIREGNMTITKFSKDDPQLRGKLNSLWTILANIDSFFALHSPPPEQIEDGATV